MGNRQTVYLHISNKNMKTQILIGSGRLGWDPFERKSDRYGSVMLLDTNEEATTFGADAQSLIGKKGSLSVRITNTRTSDHIGDLFHGIFPTTPEVGEEFTLGEGTLFIHGTEVGVRPEDEGIETFWMNPYLLYRGHSQDLDLYFTPAA